ncbi:MAG TPA: SDR family oxidoreductase [Patescibacteria group bacterium]|jgi:NAD(P)-dependent dehydrogenase (short-subunit alcohol dehydrogenase family)|nr:SDR family oxidoreductase [Patescibacteria group bacterium]
MKLNNKIAVITGGNSGIGLATAKELKQQGAQVVIIGRNAEAVKGAAREIGGETLGMVADVARVIEIDRAFRMIGKKLGRVDFLFVNAGVAKFAAATESDEALFDEITDINFKGAYFTVQKALPLLSEGASIVLTSTAVVHFGLPGASIYAAGKAALNSLAKTLAVELAGKKIRVNVVSPGPVATPIFGKLGLPKEAVDQMAANILAQVPLGRLGQSEEIAKAVAFLASTDSAFVTGQELLVDGGMAQS